MAKHQGYEPGFCQARRAAKCVRRVGEPGGVEPAHGHEHDRRLVRGDRKRTSCTAVPGDRPDVRHGLFREGAQGVHRARGGGCVPDGRWRELEKVVFGSGKLAQFIDKRCAETVYRHITFSGQPWSNTSSQGLSVTARSSTFDKSISLLPSFWR
jgi:hypothetical protein